MKAINYHIKAIISSLNALSKGKYLVYFIPGTIITLIYFFLTYKAKSVIDTIDLETGYSWVDYFGGYVDKGLEKTFSFFGMITEQIYIFVIITLLSPFNTVLGEKFDEELTGTNFKGGIIRFINDFFRMFFLVLLLIIFELFFIFIYWVISWLFGLESIDPIIYHIIAAFFFGISFYDFSLERYEKGVFSSIGFAFTYPLSMIITGSIFLLIYQIPIIGIPIAPVLSILFSTVVYLYLTKKLPKINQVNPDKSEILTK